MPFRKKLYSSEFLEQVKGITDTIAEIKKQAVPLDKKEIEKLKENNNYALNWEKLKKCGDLNLNNIRNNIFSGDIIICDNNSKYNDYGIELPCGIFNSTIQDSIIDKGVLIKDTKILKNYYIGKNSLLLNNGVISYKEDSTIGNGIEISVGIETGGREVLSYAELNIKEAELIATNRGDKTLLSDYEKFIKNYMEKITLKKGIISNSAKITNNKEIQDVFIGTASIISGSNAVRNATILSNQEEVTEIMDGAYIENAIIQWGCEVASMGIVVNSVMTEHSHVERHGKVTDSILGPNTGIGEGEVTASLVGPFVGFHHQSLLIAAIWPDGKGNIGYGANVGSNHTSKAPDQEIFPGEGLFFGLGVNIKFPSDFTKAPYSIVATGVTALPQKVEFPFSLINSPAARIENVSPAYNEIIPAWVLSDNIFTIKRNEGKYKKRNKAKRTNLIFEVFRPEIVDLMIESRKKLLSIQDKNEIYLDKDIKGLGKNYLYERSRVKAIETYTFYIQYYALKGLKERIKLLLHNGVKKIQWNMLGPLSDDERWEHEKNILKIEFSGKQNIMELLKILLTMEEKIAEDVKISKQKDDKRGRKVIPDYEDSHTLAEDDSFVNQTYKELEDFKKEIKELETKIS